MNLDIEVCCVCGGPHHPKACLRARRFVRECLTARVSPPPPEPERPPERRPDYDWICSVLREAMLAIDADDAAAQHRHHRSLRERNLTKGR